MGLWNNFRSVGFFFPPCFTLSKSTLKERAGVLPPFSVCWSVADVNPSDHFQSHKKEESKRWKINCQHLSWWSVLTNCGVCLQAVNKVLGISNSGRWEKRKKFLECLGFFLTPFSEFSCGTHCRQTPNPRLQHFAIKFPSKPQMEKSICFVQCV